MVTKCPSKTGYFKIDNLFSEIWTEAQRSLARQNLGISDTIALKWGNIKGTITQQKDLCDYVQNYMQYSNLSGDKIIYSPDKILDYNSDYVKCKNDLYIEEIKTIKEAVDLILYKLFPVAMSNWTIEANNISVTYDIEKGTKQALNLTDLIGTITITLVPGIIEDSVKTITINNTEYPNTQLSIKIPVVVGDVTTQSFIDSTVDKVYTITVTTNSGYKITKSVKASIKINTVQYYFFSSSDVSLIENNLTDFDSSSNFIKSTSPEYVFNCGQAEKYIAVLSPKNITKVETAASLLPDVSSNYFITNGYNKKEVIYRVNNALQTYYLIELIDPQCNYIKIRVS